MEKILVELIKKDGVSGYENIGGISKFIFDFCASMRGAKTSLDMMGNVLARRGNGKKKILIDAHIDEVGFLVSKITGRQTAQLLAVGSINPTKVVGARIKIFGNKNRVVDGVIRRKLKVKISDTKDISVGNWCAFQKKITIEKSEVVSPALDNRVSCAALLEFLRTFQPKNSSIYALFSTQHEQGGRVNISGWIQKLKPDFIIVLDSAYGLPDGKENWQVPKVGGGPAIQLIGNDFIVNGAIAQKIRDIAMRNKIPYQLEVPDGESGGTNASKIPNSILFCVINIPVAYQHTNKSIADVGDLRQTVRLLEAICKEFGTTASLF